MTISASISKSGPYLCDGVVTSFEYQFKIFDASHLTVIKTDIDGIESELSYATGDYTVSGVGNSSGGTIDNVSSLDGEKITILRNVPLSQDTDIKNQAGFYPVILENSLDKLTMALQQVYEETTRSVKVNPSSTVLPDDLLASIYASELASSQSAAAAAQSETNSSNSELKAGKWAEEAEDVEVEPGAYSALHHALKAAFSAASVNANNILHKIGSGLPNESYTKADIDSVLTKRLIKSTPGVKVFTTDGTATLETAFDCWVKTDAGAAIKVPGATAISLPSLTAASDYKIYCTDAGALSAQLWDTAAPANSVELGGFHVFHTTGTINPDSIWDLNFRPSCSPRGMTLSIDKRVWGDEYLMDTDYGINGYSKGGATIADGASLPKIPLIFGGNGTTTYTRFSQYEAIDLAASAGKRLPTADEFYSLAYGVVEQQAVGTDPVTTKYQAGYRSACGCEQVTGCMWQWGADVNGTSATGTVSWQAITDGRGSVYMHSIRAVLLGASWTGVANAGSRASNWDSPPSNSDGSVGARAVCDHLILD